MKYIAAILAVMLLTSPLWAVDSASNKRVWRNSTRLENPAPVPAQNARVPLPSHPTPFPITSILLVDDDGGTNNGGTFTDIQTYYTNALTAAGYSYDLCVVNWTITSPPQNGPNADSMSHYDCVIWFAGETWGYYGADVLTAADENNLATYLDNGGTLFLNAQDYLYASYPAAGSFSPGQFPYDYLGVSRVSQDIWFNLIPATQPSAVSGTVGSFVQGLSYNVIDPFPGTNSAMIWADSLVARDHSLLNATAPPPAPTPVAIQYHGTNFCTAFSTCGVEGLVDGTFQVSAYLDAVLDGFGASGVSLRHRPAVVTHYSLAQNYPNPFNPSTDIRYQLPVQGKVTLTIFNVMGQEVAKLIDERQAAGSYQVNWNAGEFPSGVYFYRLAANGFQDIRQMMLVK